MHVPVQLPECIDSQKPAAERYIEDCSQVIAKGLVDGDYAGEILGAAVEVAQRNELHKFVVIPKRWVVERLFAWLEKCRRLWKNCERKLNTSLQFIILGFLAVTAKKIGNRFSVHRDGVNHPPTLLCSGRSGKRCAASTPCAPRAWRIRRRGCVLCHFRLSDFGLDFQGA
jgi:hypothetical protein